MSPQVYSFGTLILLYHYGPLLTSLCTRNCSQIARAGSMLPRNACRPVFCGSCHRTSPNHKPAFCGSADPAICGYQLSIVKQTTPTAPFLLCLSLGRSRQIDEAMHETKDRMSMASPIVHCELRVRNLLWSASVNCRNEVSAYCGCGKLPFSASVHSLIARLCISRYQPHVPWT